jgi:ABC-type sugar transport system ATPase subunit
MSKEVICRVSNVTKIFPGVVALKNVSFDILKGEVHAVIGENGAGKSTLMNILSGVYKADEGTVEFDGKLVEFQQPKEAQEHGIAMIHQELSLAPHMPASENIYIGRMPKNKFGFIDRPKMNKDCERYLKNLGVTHVNPKTLVKELSVSEMQLLEIAKAMSLHSRMLIMDEPTSALTTAEIEFLLDIIDGLRKQGVAILYISHKLEEVMHISDRITILRDGERITTRPKAELDEKTMIDLMVGRNFEQKANREMMRNHEELTPILEVRNLYDVAGRVKDVSFKLYRGEVLGLTGLIGAGRSELLEIIFGGKQMKSGTVLIDGQEVKIKNTKDAISRGIALIPEGRKIQGLFLKLTVEDNMLSVHLKHLRNKLGFISKKTTHAIAHEYKEKLDVRTPSMKQIVNNLSGGNQQKTIIARWLMNSPKILFMDEPTHGIDIGAKSEIYRIIDELSQQGVSIILLSSEMPEVLSMCDRIMVMHHGELRGVLHHDDASQVKIMSFTLDTSSE